MDGGRPPAGPYLLERALARAGVYLDLNLEVVVPADRGHSPQRERDPTDAEHEAGPHDRLGHAE